MSRCIKIVVDHRERACRVPDRLASIHGIELSFDELGVGDYLVDGGVVFERKTIDDFASSIIDTRLFRQASRLNRSPHRSAVIVEGWFDEYQARVSREAMQGALISLALVFDIPVLHARDPDESARLVAYAARQLADLNQRTPVWQHRKPKKPWTRRLHVLQSLPGIGRDRAERLLEHFGTVERCIAASEEELCGVSGIGEKTAQAIRVIVAGSALEGPAGNEIAQPAASNGPAQSR